MSWKTTRHDKFYHLAREQGFRSRACFKLIQINRKYNFLSKCNAVLDLCAAPGGWLQVCTKYMPQGSTVIGVDILPIRALPGVITIMGDITKQSTTNEIKTHLQNHKVDAVLHDGAPNVGGNSWAKDAYGQNELVIHALRLATKYLKPDGWFVTKVFRSQDYPAVLDALKPFFTKIEATKPSSSRNASPEIFIVCQGYLAPKRIDPAALEPTLLFAGGAGQAKAKAALKKVAQGDSDGEDGEAAEERDARLPLPDKQPMTLSTSQFLKASNAKRKRNRAGYEDDAGMLLFKKGSVEEFVRSSEPIAFLMQFHELEFEAGSKLLEHPATTPEVRELLADLKVLGRGGFAALLKWRKKVLKALHEERRASGKDSAAYESKRGQAAGEDEDEDETQGLTPEEKIARQISDLQTRLEKERLKFKRLKHQQRMKMRKRQEMNPHMQDASMLDGPAEAGLFSLSDVLGQEEDPEEAERLLKALNDPDSLGDLDAMDSEDELAEREARRQAEENPIAGRYGVALDEEAYLRQMEAQLEDLHTLYQEHRKKVKERKEKLGLDAEGNPVKKRSQKKGAKAAAAGASDEDEDGEDEVAGSQDSEAEDAELAAQISDSEAEFDEGDSEFDEADEGDDDEGDDEDEEEEEEEVSGKVGQKRQLTTQDAVRVNRWFARDIFAATEDALINQQESKRRKKAPESPAAGDDTKRRTAAKAARRSQRTSSDVEMGVSGEDLTSDEEELVDEREVAPGELRKLQQRTRELRQQSQPAGVSGAGAADELGLPNPKRERRLAGLPASGSAVSKARSKNARDSKKSGKLSTEGLDEDAGVSNKLEIVPMADPSAVVSPSLFDRHGKSKKNKSGSGGDDDEDHDDDDEDSEDSLTEYSSDTDAEAEIMAMAETMLRKKNRNQILDDSYNRYTWNDPPNLPSWFVDEEEQYNKPLLPITKEQVDKFRAELRAINARPAKKIAEARARNKMRTMARWEKLKTQSEGIAGQTDLTDEEKLRSIAKLYARTPKKSIKRDKVYLVAQKGGGSRKAVRSSGGKNAKAVNVDRRMLADRRGQKASARRQKTQRKASNKRKASSKGGNQ